MRKQILVGLALLSAVCCWAETKQALALNMVSGAKVVYYLDTEPKISFSGQDMIVTADDQTESIPMADVECWEIGEMEYTGVVDIASHRTLGISVYMGHVTVTNPSDATITVYGVNGSVVGRSRERQAEFTLAKGIYLVSDGNQTIKIAIR